jgi:transcriptional regulator with XRE-family HTH domain
MRTPKKQNTYAWESLLSPSSCKLASMTPGDRIRLRRKQLGFSQRSLGAKIGVEGQSVSQWETGSTKNLRGENLVKLSKALGVSPDYITHGVELRAVRPSSVAESAVPKYGISDVDRQIFAILDTMSVSRKEALLHFLRSELGGADSGAS